ncbi:MAG: hypothetical protein KGH74_00625 [Candidatus Micrarchaeota archaeon]|nr:hypothetical protein [Candidatus Micrarchaeota archaeon]
MMITGAENSRVGKMIPAKKLIEDGKELKAVLAQAKRPIAVSHEEIGSERWTYRTRMLMFSIHRIENGTHSGVQEHDGLMFALSHEKMGISYRSRRKESRVDNVSAVVIPKGVEYELSHKAPLYTARVSARGWDRVTEPVGYSPANIDRHLQSGNAYKFVVPKHVNGEVLAKGGEFVGEHHEKHIVLGPSNQEFSVGNSLSPQDFHVHMKTTEIFVTFSGIEVYYFARGGLETMYVAAGSVLIVPKGVPHFTVMRNEKPSFVVKGSDASIIDDNFRLPDDAVERTGLSQSALSYLLRNE